MNYLPLRDTFTLKRAGTSTDSEGNPLTAYTTIGTYKGDYGTVSATGQEVAKRRGQTYNATVAVPSEVPVQLGDRIIGLRGRNYDVIDISDVRLHTRIFIREVS